MASFDQSCVQLCGFSIAHKDRGKTKDGFMTKVLYTPLLYENVLSLI